MAGYLSDALFWLAVICLVLLSAMLAVDAHAETGMASWYSEGSRVACRGMRLGPMTAAHKSLPCGARIRVTTPRGSAELTVTDRGPYVRNRIVDVSPDAARALGLVGPGVLPVTVEVLR